MLFLIFQLGQDFYALDTAQVVEVVPMLRCKEIPQAPAGVAGILNYHGEPVPLIDLAALSLGKSSRPRMSTRIILVNYAEAGGEMHLLGLLAEQTTETIHREETDFVDAGVAADGTPYLGRVTKVNRGTDSVGRAGPAAQPEMLSRPALPPTAVRKSQSVDDNAKQKSAEIERLYSGKRSWPRCSDSGRSLTIEHALGARMAACRAGNLEEKSLATTALSPMRKCRS